MDNLTLNSLLISIGRGASFDFIQTPVNSAPYVLTRKDREVLTPIHPYSKQYDISMISI